MTNIKLCLGSLALFALHATIIATPALAAPGRPVVCTTRPLVQGSGNVRICAPASAGAVRQ